MKEVSFRMEEMTQLLRGRCMLIVVVADIAHFSLCTDNFFEFGECLGKEEVVLQKIWHEAMGRYDRAMRHLVVDVLYETENPVENLVQSLEKMTTNGSQQAAQTIQKGNVYKLAIVTSCDYWL